MKILLAVDKYSPAVNGVITSVVTLKKALELQGHEVKVLTLSESASTWEEDNVTYIGSFDVGKIYPDARLRHPTLRRYIQSLANWRPGIIHTNTEFSTFHLAREIARLAMVPMVHTYHTDYEDYVHYVYLSKRIGKHFVKWYIRYVTSCMVALIAPTEKTKKQLISYGIKKLIKVIPTGLDLDKYNQVISEEELDNIRTKYGIKKDIPSLIFVGRLGKEKNIPQVIDYLAKNKDIPFQFIITGDGPAKDELVKIVKDKGLEERTIFTGMVPQSDIQKYYRLASLFISASQSETQGLTYIEALCAAVPILCRKDPCLNGVVEEGVNGWCFEDEEQFSTHLRSFLASASIRDKMSKDAKELAFKHFGSATFASSVLELYDYAIKNYVPRKDGLLKALYLRILSRMPLI